MNILSGRTAWRTHECQSSGVLVDGRDYFCAFYDAVLGARRSVLLLGWQFDSNVLLVRGADRPADSERRDYELLSVLDRLCRERPGLEIRVLAWDHSFVFTFERELLQKLVFDAITSERFDFRWDDTVPLGGSHHQKLAIIDGRIAFVGSMDLCQSRWDDSSHRPVNEDRTTRFGIRYKPYHEVQSALTGPVVRSLTELFVQRWHDATGEELDPAYLIASRGISGEELRFPVTVPLAPGRVGISRTLPAVLGRDATYEVRDLLVSAIHHAEHLVYVETQYLTSAALRDALLSRMRDASRPKLEIVIVLPRKPEKLKEELTIGAPQARLLAAIAETARLFGHALGIYNVSADRDRDVLVYIHSKLLVVDDRFLTLGSTNLTNRSMTLDSELNVSWEASSGDRQLRSSIRRVRARLLLEHVGCATDLRSVVPAKGLVARLDALADSNAGRLRRHDIGPPEQGAIAKAMQDLALEVLDPYDGVEPSAA